MFARRANAIRRIAGRASPPHRDGDRSNVQCYSRGGCSLALAVLADRVFAGGHRARTAALRGRYPHPALPHRVSRQFPGGPTRWHPRRRRPSGSRVLAGRYPFRPAKAAIDFAAREFDAFGDVIRRPDVGGRAIWKWFDRLARFGGATATTPIIRPRP